MKTHTCHNCKKEFSNYKTVAKYCSRKCTGISRTIKTIEIYCKYCGIKRVIKPILLEKNRGKYCSVGCARKDHPPVWMHTDYTGRGEKISKKLKGKYTEEKSWRWKVETNYGSIHMWIRTKLGQPKECSNCGAIETGHRIHWSNISGKYLRDIKDWQRLCAKCHTRYDREKGVHLF